MTGIAILCILAGMTLVRLGWDGRRGVAALGWAIGAAALVWLAAQDGAWGIAVGTVAGIAAALTFVLIAGWRSPAKVMRPPREAPSIVLPRRWSGLARRMAVFALVVPVAFAAAQWLAFGAQALARRGGAGDADAIVLTLFLQPSSWAAIMAWQMTRAGPTQMIAAPVATAVVGTILWSLS